MVTSINAFHEAAPLNPAFSVGKVRRVVQAKFSIASGTQANDVFILADGIPAGARIVRIMTPKGTTAMTGVSVDIGLYKTKANFAAPEGGETYSPVTYEEIDGDCLADGQSLATALGNVDILGANIASFDKVKTLAELSGDTDGNFPAGGYAVGVKAAAVGGTGDVELDIYIEQD